MSRLMAADDTELFRAVVTTTETHIGTQVPHTYPPQIIGPYRTKAAATQAIGRERRDRMRWSHRYDVEVTGHVERATVTWEPVS